MTKRWRLAILIPLLYLLLAWAIQYFFFEPYRDGEGFLPFDRANLPAGILVVSVYAGFLWYLLERAIRQNRQVRRALASKGVLNREILFLQQLREFVYCDLVCLPGIVVFLLTADMTLLFALCAVSMLLYLRVMPREDPERTGDNNTS